MENQNSDQQPKQPSAAAITSYCQKKKNEQATFLGGLKDHMDDFIHASMDEHKSCFKKITHKMLGMSKTFAAQETKQVGSSLPIRSLVSDQ